MQFWKNFSIMSKQLKSLIHSMLTSDNAWAISWDIAWWDIDVKQRHRICWMHVGVEKTTGDGQTSGHPPARFRVTFCPDGRSFPKELGLFPEPVAWSRLLILPICETILNRTPAQAYSSRYCATTYLRTSPLLWSFPKQLHVVVWHILSNCAPSHSVFVVKLINMIFGWMVGTTVVQ